METVREQRRLAQRPGRGAIAFVLLTLAGQTFAGTVSANVPMPAGHPATAVVPKKAGKPVAPLDINSASKAQLKTLPGIGDAEAGRIIASRPYLSKADIVANAGIPAGVYLSIRHKIIALQKTLPKPKG